MNEDKDIPGVVAPPPAIFALALVVGLGLDFLWPLPVLAGAARVVLGAVLIAAGAAVLALVVREFRRQGTSINPYRPTGALITGGPFRLSRNPAYVGLAVLCLGVAVAAGGAWTLASLVPALVLIHRGVVLREERYLERRFGDAYRRYRAQVRRWL